ncbi:hypothetical protein [Roseibium sp. M-1]
MSEESDNRDREPSFYKVVDFLDTVLSFLFGDVLTAVLILVAVVAVAALAAGLVVEFAIGLAIIATGAAAVRFLSDWA